MKELERPERKTTTKLRTENPCHGSPWFIIQYRGPLYVPIRWSLIVHITLHA